MKNKAIKGTLIITIVTILSKFLGFLKEMLIANNFGSSYLADIYVFSYGITTMIFSSIGLSIKTTFIPILVSLMEQRNNEERNYFVNNIINITIIIGLCLSILGITLSKYVVLIFGPGFATNYTSEVFILTIQVVRIMFLSFVFISVQNILSGLLQAHQEYTIPAIMTVFFNLVIIIYIIVWSDRLGIYGLSIAIVIAFIVQVIVHVPRYTKLGYKYKLVLNFRDCNLKTMLKLMVPVLLGSSVTQANFMVDRMLASKIGEGAISTMNYANKLNLLIYNICGTAISTVVYSNLSRLWANENEKIFSDVIVKSINIMNIILIPSTIGMIILRDPLIILAYKRGMFDDRDVITTASILLCYAPSMIAYGIRDILDRSFYAMQDTKTPMINGCIGVLINIILNIFLSKYLGINGLAIATTISSVVTTIVLFYKLNNKIITRLYKIKVCFIKIIISATIMGVVVYFTSSYMEGVHSNNIILIIIAAIIGIVVYIICLYLFKVDEFMYILEKINRKYIRKED
ncbi:MAG: murein biosynthesis integral membrane protein MurJ [Clostridium sulfidigenes]|uniref:Probable lipid II flippase MurJ n=1 Tax=Clostridium sulfidigenes TaxID=318464 RepID=A0A927ZN17_9CLOT|nr:murein biosynthesis integral membrane protein MurJ [Clostridium sulfidigenes]